MFSYREKLSGTCQEECVPIYMEAATEYCWGLYKKLGFVTVEDIWLGKERANADGTQCPRDRVSRFRV